MKQLKKFLFKKSSIVGACLFVSSAWAGNTYTIEPGESIQQAVNNCSIGDTVLIKAGIYREHLTFSGTSSLVVKAEEPGSVIIDGENKTGGFYDGVEVTWGIGIDSTATNLLLDGLTLTNFIGKAIYIRNSKDLKFININVINSDYGVYLSPGTRDVSFDKVNVKNLRKGNGFHFDAKPITTEITYEGAIVEVVDDEKPISNIVVKNSEVKNVYNCGIWLDGSCKDFTIDNCVLDSMGHPISDTVPYGANGGIHICGSESVWYYNDTENPTRYRGTDNIVVSNTSVRRSYRQGICVYNAQNVILVNNKLFENAATGIQVENGSINFIIDGNETHNNQWIVDHEMGIWIDDSEYGIIKNNRVHNERVGIGIGKASNDIIVRNNRIYDIDNHDKLHIGIEIHDAWTTINQREATEIELIDNSIPKYKIDNPKYGKDGDLRDSIVVVDKEDSNNRIRVFNNTINNVGVNGVGKGIGLLFNMDYCKTGIDFNKDIKFVNNIIENIVGEQGQYNAIAHWDDKLTTFTSSNNSFFNSGPFKFLKQELTLDEYQKLQKIDLSIEDNSIIASAAFELDNDERFSLSSASPCIDAGMFLTKTKNSGDNSRLLEVVDPHFFCDGFGLSEGDKIVVGMNTMTTIQNILMNSVDGSDITLLELKDEITWDIGENVSLDFYGNKPDIGAVEFITEIDLIAPSKPNEGESTYFLTHVSSNYFDFTWKPSHDNVGVVDYEVKYSCPGLTESLIKMVGSDNNRLLLGALRYSTTYTISVRAKDIAGNMSDYFTGSLSTDAPYGYFSWNRDCAYLSGDIVTLNGKKFKAKWWSQGQNPEKNCGSYDVWEYIGQ